LKEADALDAAGHHVRVVTVNAHAASWQVDQALVSSRRWKLDALDAQRRGPGRSLWLLGALRQQLYRKSRWLRNRQRGLERALFRYADEFSRLVAAKQADLYIAHSLEALLSAVAAARRWRAKVGIDFEDFYSGIQTVGSGSPLERELVAEVEAKYIGCCDYQTAASPGVAAAIASRYQCASPPVILNVFPLENRPQQPYSPDDSAPIRLYWFSQVIGRHRGLEDAVHAIAKLPRGSVELHLRGYYGGDGSEYLQKLIVESHIHPQAVHFHAYERTDRMVRLAAHYDVGLALEVPISENRLICMKDLCTNKVFTYLLAGLALAATAVDAGGDIYEGAGFSYRQGDSEALAAGLKRWLDDRPALNRAKAKAWQLGETRYNWDVEKKKLLLLVDEVLKDRPLSSQAA